MGRVVERGVLAQVPHGRVRPDIPALSSQHAVVATDDDDRVASVVGPTRAAGGDGEVGAVLVERQVGAGDAHRRAPPLPHLHGVVADGRRIDRLTELGRHREGGRPAVQGVEVGPEFLVGVRQGVVDRQIEPPRGGVPQQVVGERDVAARRIVDHPSVGLRVVERQRRTRLEEEGDDPHAALSGHGERPLLARLLRDRDPGDTLRGGRRSASYSNGAPPPAGSYPTGLLYGVGPGTEADGGASAGAGAGGAGGAAGAGAGAGAAAAGAAGASAGAAGAAGSGFGSK